MIPYSHRCICRRDFQKWDCCDICRHSQCSLHRITPRYTLPAMEWLHASPQLCQHCILSRFQIFAKSERWETASLSVVLICNSLFMNRLLIYSKGKGPFAFLFVNSVFVSLPHFLLGYGSSWFLIIFTLEGLALWDMYYKQFFLSLSFAFWFCIWCLGHVCKLFNFYVVKPIHLFFGF